MLLLIPFIYIVNIQSSFDLLIKSIAASCLLFILSFIFPIHRSVWERRIYVLSEILLISITLATGVEASFMLYFILIKSCFLLSRRDVMISIVTGGIGCLAGIALSYPSLIARRIDASGFPVTFTLPEMLFTALIYYLTVAIFVLLLGFMIVAERQSRQRAEALAKEVETMAVNLERMRISREIHDSLGHTFTSLGIQLELAQKLRDRNMQTAFRSIDNAALLVTQGLQDVRQLVQTMRQNDFDLKDGLYESIEQLRQQSITVHLDLRLPPLPLQISHQLYRIIKEGLMNIQKHAQADHVILKGHTTVTELVVVLEDNGRGFDTHLFTAGCGLRGMKERVQILDGSLIVNTTPRKGTELEIRIPYDSSISG
jgi:signal transduction histidine kinase